MCLITCGGKVLNDDAISGIHARLEVWIKGVVARHIAGRAASRDDIYNVDPALPARSGSFPGTLRLTTLIETKSFSTKLIESKITVGGMKSLP